MTLVPRTKPRAVVATQVLSDRPPAAEVLVGPQSITVTVAVPQIAEADVDIVLTRHSIRIRSKRDAAALSFVVPLPVAVEPERYVLRHQNGVYDFVVERPSH